MIYYIVDILQIYHSHVITMASQSAIVVRSGAFVYRLCRGEDQEEVKPGEMKRTGEMKRWMHFPHFLEFNYV